MKNQYHRFTSRCLPALTLAAILAAPAGNAAIALDRTRVILNGSERAGSVEISNQNKELPYLAQAWIEDAQGTKSKIRWWRCRQSSGWKPVKKAR